MLDKLFRRRFLDADTEAWCLDTFAWLMRHRGGMEALASSRLVLPNTDFFPKTEAEGHERAVFVFDCIRREMGMEDWSCSLVPFRRRGPDKQVSDFVFVRNEGAPDGYFEATPDGFRIGYAADLVDKPFQLAATLAHELAHFLIYSIDEAMPGGEDVHELTTEACVAYSGLGLFGANNAFGFAQHGDAFGQGWRSERHGYLSERVWAFLLAIFLVLKGEPPPDRWLKPTLGAMTRKAMKYLSEDPSKLAPLRAIA